MICRWCGGLTAVLDSRPTRDGYEVRRRRRCTSCNRRSTTFEIEFEFDERSPRSREAIQARIDGKSEERRELDRARALISKIKDLLDEGDILGAARVHSALVRRTDA